MEDTNLVKIKIRCTPRNLSVETYKLKMGTFELESPEEILQLLNNFDKEDIWTETTSTFGKTETRNYDTLVYTNRGLTDNHPLQIRNGLTKYLFLSNVLENQKQ